MSSFTMCQHVLNSSVEEITALLKRCEIPGIIVGKTETGITLVVEPEDSEIIQGETCCISMTYFEDAGFVLTVADRGEELGSIHYMWEGELLFQLSDNFVENMVSSHILPKDKIEKLKIVLANVNQSSFEPDDINSFIDDITSLYGFVGYEYLSYDFLCRHADDFGDQYSELTFIDA